jgi:hypothetical protein
MGGGGCGVRQLLLWENGVAKGGRRRGMEGWMDEGWGWKCKRQRASIMRLPQINFAFSAPSCKGGRISIIPPGSFLLPSIPCVEDGLPLVGSCCCCWTTPNLLQTQLAYIGNGPRKEEEGKKKEEGRKRRRRSLRRMGM